MHTPFAMIALCASVLLLGGCDKTPTASETPMADTPVQTESAATARAVDDPSVPAAESVLPPVNATKADPTPGGSNDTMSSAQESTAMPMPGQNNDHSTPLRPAKRANSP